MKKLGALLVCLIAACSSTQTQQQQPAKITCNSTTNFSMCSCTLNGDGLALCSRDFLGPQSKCCAQAGWKTDANATCTCRSLPKCFDLQGTCICGLYEWSGDASNVLTKGYCSKSATGHCCDDGVSCICSVLACNASDTEVAQCEPKAKPCTDVETEVFSCTD